MFHTNVVPVDVPGEGRMRIAYTEKGSGKSLVFLHGMGGAGSDAEILFKNIPAGWHVIGIHFPGHGLSDKLPLGRFYTFEFFVNVVEAFLDAMEITHAYFVGTSMGGTVQLKLSARRPERVIAQAIQGAPFTQRDFPSRALKVFAATGYAFSSGIMFLDGLINKEWLMRVALALIAPELQERIRKDPRARAVLRENVKNLDPRAVLQLTHELVTKIDLTEEIEAITAPTLLIDGDRVILPAIDTSRRIASFLKNAKRVETRFIKDTGHLAPFSRAREFCESVISFFDANEPRAAQ